MNNIITYLRDFGSGMSNVSWFLLTTYSGHNYTSQSDAVIPWYCNSHTKNFTEFEQCSCSVSLVLPNTVPFLYDQVADIRPRKTSGVVTTLTGNPSQVTHSKTRTHIESVLRVQVLHGAQYSLRCLSGWSNVQITEQAGSVSCSEYLPLVTAINFIHNFFLFLDWVKPLKNLCLLHSCSNSNCFVLLLYCKLY